MTDFLKEFLNEQRAARCQPPAPSQGSEGFEGTPLAPSRSECPPDEGFEGFEGRDMARSAPKPSPESPEGGGSGGFEGGHVARSALEPASAALPCGVVAETQASLPVGAPEQKPEACDYFLEGERMCRRCHQGWAAHHGTEATVSVTPPAKPNKLTVSLDGTVSCHCGARGHIPHHLSLAFWEFWTLERLQAIEQQMRPGERLAWIAHRLVRLQPAGDISDANARILRERDGVWSEEQQGDRK
jgi:hypothetical protein